MGSKYQGLSCVFCAFLSCAPISAFAVTEGQAAPSFTLPAVAGQTISLEQYRGKVVYLDFWASWCGPCKESLPFLNEMQKRFAEKGVVVLAVNVDKSHDAALAMLAKVNPEFTVLFDPEGKVPAQFALPTMPSSFLIDRDGSVKMVHRGFRPGDKEELMRAVESLAMGGKQ